MLIEYREKKRPKVTSIDKWQVCLLQETIH